MTTTRDERVTGTAAPPTAPRVVAAVDRWTAACTTLRANPQAGYESCGPLTAAARTASQRSRATCTQVTLITGRHA